MKGSVCPPWSNTQAGFSFIELLVVIAIFGIITAIAVPAFQVVRLATALSAGQRDVAAALQNARWGAINNGSTRTVDLTSASQVLVQNNGGTTLLTVSLSGYFVTQTHTGGTSFNFDSRGLIPSGTTTPITITLSNPRSSTRTVTVDRLGRITTS